MDLFEYFENSEGGRQDLIAAELRYDILRSLNFALDKSGLTKKELADNLGVSKSEVNKVFRGDGDITINTLSQYAHTLGFKAIFCLTPK